MSERAQRLLEYADDELILGWRDSEWTGIAPSLEEDVAFSSIAQNEIGHARALYELAARELGTTADELAFDRSPDEYRCAPLVELRRLDWAHTIARHWLYETADELRLAALKESDDEEVAGLAAKMDREEVYHRLHARMWADRLRDEPRFLEAVAGAVALRRRRPPRGTTRCSFRPCPRDSPWDSARRARCALGRAPPVVGGDDDGAAQRAGRDVVTAAQVWDALAEIPDPEIPVISLVDLGVVKDVHVDGDAVRIEFTPTFLGCPALEVMRDAMAEKVRALGAEPHVDVVLDDSWSTDRITPRGPREAACVRLRATVAAPRAAAAARRVAARLPLSVLRLDRHEAREPLRPDAVPQRALLQRLPPAVRAVQDDLTRYLRPSHRVVGGPGETSASRPPAPRSRRCRR